MTEKAASNQRVTNALLARALEDLETNMEKGFKRIEKGQGEEKKERKELTDNVIQMTVNYAECSAIQGQRWEAHNKVHEGLRPRRDQNIVDIGLAALAVAAGAIGITIKN